MKTVIGMAVALAALGFGLGTSGAVASEPQNQACLGHDFSGYAMFLQPFGQSLTTFSVDGTPIIEGGLGSDIQAHLAGDVPDSVIPNSCND